MGELHSATDLRKVNTVSAKIVRTMSGYRNLLVVAFVLVLSFEYSQGMGWRQTGRSMQHGQWRQQSSQQLPDIGGLFKKKVAAKAGLLGGLLTLKKKLLAPIIGIKKKLIAPIIGIKKKLLAPIIGIKKKLVAKKAGLLTAKLGLKQKLIGAKMGLLGGLTRQSSGGHRGHRGWQG